MDEIESDELQKVSGGLSILERMVNQNTYDDISQDFKYWEDAADEFRSGQGSLLPLWKLSYEKARKYSVTSLKWNSKYKGLYLLHIWLQLSTPIEGVILTVWRFY